MARRRKPCDFCEDDNYGDYIEHRNGYCLWYEFYPFKQNLYVICQANDEEGNLIEDAITFDVNFCPNCGARMEEE